jgi:hypothetical protein
VSVTALHSKIALGVIKTTAATAAPKAAMALTTLLPHLAPPTRASPQASHPASTPPCVYRHPHICTPKCFWWHVAHISQETRAPAHVVCVIGLSWSLWAAHELPQQSAAGGESSSCSSDAISNTVSGICQVHSATSVHFRLTCRGGFFAVICQREWFVYGGWSGWWL